MKGVRRFRDRLREDLKDPDFRKAFEKEEVYASLGVQVARIRGKGKHSRGAFTVREAKTYMDRLMGDKEFRKRFDEEYQNLCLGKQIARARYQVQCPSLLKRRG